MVNITLEEKEKISIELLLTGKFAKQQSNNLFAFFGQRSSLVSTERIVVSTCLMIMGGQDNTFCGEEGEGGGGE